MNFVYMDITILVISIILSGMIFVFFVLKNRKPSLHIDSDKAFCVIDIVKALENVCPLSVTNKWQLLSLNYGAHRCWTRNIYFSTLNANIYLFGSTAIVDCPSSHAFALIADAECWTEWNPCQVSKLYVKAFQDQQLKKDFYMKADQIVGVQRGTKVQSFTAMFRFYDISDEEVGWLLFWNVKKLEFLFFMMQPVVNSRNKQCLITHILGTDLENSSHLITLVTQRLRNIKDFISLTSLDVTPLKFETLKLSKEGCSYLKCALGKTHPGKVSSLLSMQTNERNCSNLFELVPFSYHPQCTLKNLKGFHLTVKKINQRSKATSFKKMKKKECASSLSVNGKVGHILKRTSSDLTIKPNNFKDENRRNLNISYINLEKTNTNDFKTLKQKSENVQEVCNVEEKEITKWNSEHKTFYEDVNSNFSHNSERSLSEIVTSGSNKSRTLTELNVAENSNVKGYCLETQNTEENISEEKVLITSKKCQDDFSSSTSDFEVIETGMDLSDCRIAYFVTQGNYGASELQAEVLLASELMQNMTLSQIPEVGGWTYYSNYKGLSVFAKNTCSHFMKISSFLCQTEIPLAQKDVWKFVKNPRFRFMCDETVKLVKIIDKISPSQKLLHIYHEIGGILKKEMVDFCLLHTERKELNRYYCAFHSVEYETCPFMNSVTRGILRPSGWIVEEIEDKAKASKVTYMMQILNSQDSLFQDLCTLVPQSLINLKNYATSIPM